MAVEIGHYIDGKRVAGGSGRTGDVTNPATGEVVAHMATGGRDVVARALSDAHAAFPAWRRTSRGLRAEAFDRLAQLIKRDTDSLAELMARECGKNITECRAEEIGRASCRERV